MRKLVVLAVAVTLLPAGHVARAARVIRPAPDNAILAAAGDIACQPSDSNFNGGLGNAGACRMEQTADLLARINPAVVAPLGDLQYEGGAHGDWGKSYHKSWGQFWSRTRPAPGNHEYGTKGAAGYFDYFKERAGPTRNGWYSYELGDWHLIALNSNCGAVGGCGPGSPQEKWLRSDLAASPARCTLAYWHHPRFSSGPHGDTGGVDGLWKALYEGGADVVLSGHDHLYERFAPLNGNGQPDAGHGIRSFVVGTGGKTHYGAGRARAGSQARNDNTFGVAVFRLRATSYDWVYVPELRDLGRFHDSGRGTCHGKPGA